MSTRCISFITALILGLLLLTSASSYADREVKETEEKIFEMEPEGIIKITVDEGLRRTVEYFKENL